ncbi:hypothetical protein FQR65_LT04594 [Abscondita terminalis]|nr:hypothetical protein FQR65_LT04594 [Abscondita terminalis]
MKVVTCLLIILSALAITSANIETIKSNSLEKCATRLIRLMFRNEHTLNFLFNNHEDLFKEIDIPHIRINTNFEFRDLLRTYSYNYVIHAETYNSYLKILRSVVTTTLWKDSLTQRGKTLIITEETNIDILFQLIWKLRTIKTIVLQYEQNDTNNFTLNVYRADPSAFENDCGRRPNLISVKNCDDVTSVEFPQVITNYNKCLVMFGLSNSDSLQTPNNKFYKVLLGIMDEVYGYATNDSSNIFFEDDFVWIGTEPKLQSPFKMLFVPFTNSVWMMILLVLICVVLIWFLIISIFSDSSLNYVNLCQSFSNAVSLMFAVSISTIPNFASLKLLIIFYLVYIIHMQTAYTSDIVNDLIAPKFENQILNLESLAESDVPIFVLESMHSFLTKNEKYGSETYFKLKKKFIVISSYGDIHSYSLTNYFTVSTRSLYFIDWSGHKQVTKNFRDHFYNNDIEGSYRCVFQTLVGHYFLESLNKVLTFFFESGLYVKNDVVPSVTNTSIKVTNVTFYKTDHYQVFEELSLKHLSYLIIMFVMGCSISGINQIADLISIQNCDDITSIEFPRTINNYNRCPVTFGVSTKQAISTNSTKNKYSNVLFEIMNQLRDSLNATVSYQHVPPTSILNVSKYVNILICDVVYGSSNDNSHIFFEDDYVWIGSEPKLRSPFKTFFAPFTNVVWMMFVLVLFCVILLWFLITSVLNETSLNYVNLFSSFSHTVSLTFAVSISTIPNVASLKLLIISYLVYIIHMNAAYTSNIINHLVVPKFEYRILDLETLAESDFPIFILDVMYSILIKHDKDSSHIYYKLKNKFIVINSYKDIYDYHFENYFIISTKSMYLIDWANNNEYTRKFRDHFYSNDMDGSFRSVFQTATGHYIRDSLNEIITFFFESGLYGKFDVAPSVVIKTNSLEKCATRIIKLMFHNDHTLNFLFDHEDLFGEIDNPHVRINTNFAVQDLLKTYSYNSYIIHANNFNSFLNIMGTITTTNLWHYSLSTRGKMFIITEEKNISHFFQFIWSKRTTKLIILQYENNHSKNVILNVYKSDPFAFENDCGRRANLISIETCDAVTRIEFPKIISNYNGCFVMFGISTEVGIATDTPSNKFTNVIFGIMKGVRDALNATVSYQHVPATFEVNVSKYFNIFVCDANFGSSLDNTHIFFEDDYVWIGTEPRLISPFKMMFLPFTNGVWMMILLVLICVIFLWFLILLALTDSSLGNEIFLLTFSRAVSLMFAVSISSIPNIASLKLLIISYLVYIIHMHTAYTSDIINDLVVPKFDDQIRNLETLAETDIPIFIMDILYSILITNDQNRPKIYSKLKKKFIVIHNYNEIYNFSFDKYFIVTTKSVSVVSFGTDKEITRKFRDRFYNNDIDGSFRSIFQTGVGHCFRESLNKVITYFFESGLYFKYDVAPVVNNSSVAITNLTFYKTEHFQHFDALSLNHFSHLIIVYGIGCGISTIIFAIELFVFKYKI